jgi:hypothetical protein
LKEKGFGRFDDIDCVTMFADYRVPQQLCALGVLRYSIELQQALRKEEKVRNNCCVFVGLLFANEVEAVLRQIF